jgi:hypothetical protein
MWTSNLDMNLQIVVVKAEAGPMTGTQISYVFFKKPIAWQTIMAATSVWIEFIILLEEDEGRLLSVPNSMGWSTVKKK